MEKISGLKSQVITLDTMSWNVEVEIKLKLLQNSDILLNGVAGLVLNTFLHLQVREVKEKGELPQGDRHSRYRDIKVS